MAECLSMFLCCMGDSVCFVSNIMRVNIYHYSTVLSHKPLLLSECCPPTDGKTPEPCGSFLSIDSPVSL